MRDPDVDVRATLRYSPEPNPNQRQSFVRAYLDADRAADALSWLDGSWGHLERSRQALLAETLEHLGRHGESAPIRQRLFERTLDDIHYQHWLECLPASARGEATARARTVALGHDEVAAAAEFLLTLGDAAAAEQKLLVDAARIDGNDYVRLAPLARTLHACERLRGEIAVLRALTRAILDRGYTRAYGHAGRYWARMVAIAESGADLRPLPSHAEFEAEIRSRHARKASFWTRAESARHDPRGSRDDGDDPEEA